MAWKTKIILSHKIGYLLNGHSELSIRSKLQTFEETLDPDPYISTVP